MAITWNVTIKKAWRELEFVFETAEDAEAFASTAAESYVPDMEKMSIAVSAVIAENVVKAVEEEEGEE